MENIRCINCSFLNFATASVCKRCGLPFDSAANADSDPNAYAPQEDSHQPPEGGSYFWDQPSPPQSLAPLPVYKNSGMSPMLKIIIAVVVVAMVSALAIPRLLKTKKTDLTNLTWNEFRSPDERFSVSLPSAPKLSDRVVPSRFGNAEAHIVESDLGKEVGCMVMYADYPIERLNVSEETLYDMALQGATSRQTTMAIGARRYITLDGYRGIEAELKPTDPAVSGAGGLRIFWVSPRLYVLGAGGPNTPEFKAVQAKFFESFHLHRGR